MKRSMPAPQKEKLLKFEDDAVFKMKVDTVYEPCFFKKKNMVDFINFLSNGALFITGKLCNYYVFVCV